MRTIVTETKSSIMRTLLIFVALLFGGMNELIAQETDSACIDKAQLPCAERKKVAVVLSGGGAKGMAHIGALKVIERAGIPVDIITGTSMGSIIGGLYAIGYNANVLDSVVRIQDWSYVITDKENLENQSLDDRCKQNKYAFTTGLTIGKRNQNDGGIIKGKNLAELFQNLCAGYTDSLDFSRDLPIPYACVATDIIDNTEFDFHSGYLPQAMRASMAIPVVFSPVRIGNHVLVDGGLRNNYPADIAREMGADIIIGVTVQGEAKDAESMGHTLSILSQIIDVNCKNKYDENLEFTDVPIRVNTMGYGAASFSHAAIDTLIRRGEEEAMKHWDDLVALKQRIGIDDSFRPQLLTPAIPAAMTKKRKVVAYEFENMTQKDERFLIDKFKLHNPLHHPSSNSPKPTSITRHDSIDTDRKQQLTTSMRMDLFYQTAECRLVPEGDGVRVILTAGNRKTSQVHVGVRYDNEEHASVQVGADFPIKGPVPISTDVTVRLGKRLMAAGELTFHPRSFTSPQLSYTYLKNDLDFYHEGDRDYNLIYRQHQTELIPLRITMRHMIIQAGLRWDILHYRDKLLSSKSVNLPLNNEHYFSYRASLNYNGEDDWYFPTRGSRFKIEYAYITDDFAGLEDKPGLSDVNAYWRKSFALTGRFTLQPMLFGRLLFGTNIPHVFSNAIGGDWFGQYVEQQIPFAGVGYVETIDNKFAGMQLVAQERIGSNHYMQLRLSGAQQSHQLAQLFDHRTVLGCEVAYNFKTMFGPVGVSLGYSNRTHKPCFYMNLGFRF